MRNKILVVVLGVMCIILNHSCQKEESLIKDELVLEPEIHTKVTKVSQADISNIINLINTNPSLNKANNSLSREADTAIEVDYSEIYQVIDSIGNTNHTFRLNVTDNNPHTFYNLVIYQNAQTQSPNPYVLKFEVNEDALESFVLSDYNFDTFDGVVKRYTLGVFSALMEQSYSSATGRPDENVDDCPCEEDVVPPRGGNGGGNADGGGDFDPTIEDIDEDCEYVTYVQGCSGSNGNIYHLQSSCGPDDYVEALSRIVRHCGSESAPLFLNERTEDDCNNPCEDTGGSTVILTPKGNIIQVIEECLEVPVSSLNLNGVQTTAIANYIKINGCSEQTSAFASLAVEALQDNDNDGQPDGEVDFENKIIKDSSFIGTKADCVLNELISSGNNIFKTVSEAFTGNRSLFLLRFTVDNVQGGAAATTPLPMDNGVITIKFSPDYVNSMSAIVTAKEILHEIIHAELHRIYISENQGPNPLPQNLYNWYINMWEAYQNLYPNQQGVIAGEAEHFYMAANYIDNIASGLREFDNNSYNIETYHGIAWEGLEGYGEDLGYLEDGEFSQLQQQSTIIDTDNNQNPCDE